MDFARHIVSGRKARFMDASLGLDLDLVQLTDRIILMGYPATGISAMYRNQRKDVLRFLDHFVPDSNYMIMNLCPRYENTYDSNEFPGLVRRSPWPDHYPPPLSLLPIMVNRIRQFMDQSSANVLIIHCKVHAGKGRSGTCALSYLLTQPGLPSAPALPGSEAIDPRPVTPTQLDEPASKQAKLESLFDFHTSRRMAPGTTSRGVSIASQRRWLRYWARMLDGEDPRANTKDGVDQPRTSKLIQIRILLKEDSASWTRKLLGDHISVQVYRYKDSIATRLQLRELAVQQGSQDQFDDNKWDDEDEMIVRVADFKELSVNKTAPPSANPSGAATPNTLPTTPVTSAPHVSLDDELEKAKAQAKCRQLSCSAVYRQPSRVDSEPLSKDQAKLFAREQDGLEVDIDREIELKLLLGKSGSTHAALPAMAAVGIIWIVPSFEGIGPSGQERRVVTVPANEIDFLKPQAHILAVELEFA
ncbi:Telomerase protein component 1 [Microbotryomycetes sp. JL201]|nr:Telomerase protein component 1 [Microbotryomycetes sp. JL201]